MPREHEEIDDIPDRREYDVLPAGYYTGHIWQKSNALMRNKKDGNGQFPMWSLTFRLTHTLKGEELKKPVIVYTDFFQNQMVAIKTDVGHPMQGKPVIVGVIVEEYDQLGNLEFDTNGDVKIDFETGKPKRKLTKVQRSKIDRGDKGQGQAEVKLNPKGETLTLDQMDVCDLEEGRTRDADHWNAESSKEDLPF